jgi:hypothetical protein
VAAMMENQSHQHLARDQIALILYVSVVIKQADPAQAEEFDHVITDSWIPIFADALAEVESPVCRVAGVLLQSFRGPR